MAGTVFSITNPHGRDKIVDLAKVATPMDKPQTKQRRSVTRNYEELLGITRSDYRNR